MTFQPGSARYIKGMAAETEFASIMKARGHKVVKTSRSLDLQHVDFMINDTDAVDVKGAKRVCGKVCYSKTWVEITGQYGAGWLWAEKPTHFAFQQAKGFLIIRKEHLQAIVREHYAKATQVTQDVSVLAANTKTHCYSRKASHGYGELKHERVVLVATSLIREKAIYVNRPISWIIGKKNTEEKCENNV